MPFIVCARSDQRGHRFETRNQDADDKFPYLKGIAEIERRESARGDCKGRQCKSASEALARFASPVPSRTERPI